MNVITNFSKLVELSLPMLLLKKAWEHKGAFMLFALVLAHAGYVAFLSEQIRNETSELEDLRHEQYELEMEWESLRLEQGALAEHNRIENIAQSKLQMTKVNNKNEVIIEDQ